MHLLGVGSPAPICPSNAPGPGRVFIFVTIPFFTQNVITVLLSRLSENALFSGICSFTLLCVCLIGFENKLGVRGRFFIVLFCISDSLPYLGGGSKLTFLLFALTDL